MKELDFIKQQILEIEDFDNISDELKAQIESDDEYRALFESLREMSKTVASACPAPEKGGVSLRGAVMKRIEDGDTAPRYINTKSFGFPFATVACLAAFAVVVFISKSGFMQKSFEAEVAADMNYSVAEVSVENGIGAASGGAGGAAVYKSGSGTDEAAKEYVIFKGKATDRQAADEVPGGAMPRESVNAEFQAASSDRAVAESGMEKSRSDGEAATYNFSVFADELKAVREEAEEAVLDDADTADCEAESICLSEKALSCISAAAELCGGENRITMEQILLLGEEEYIEFFESISGNEDFKELYSYENFRAFCIG